MQYGEGQKKDAVSIVNAPKIGIKTHSNFN
jgi:hypothetical protein